MTLDLALNTTFKAAAGIQNDESIVSGVMKYVVFHFSSLSNKFKHVIMSKYKIFRLGPQGSDLDTIFLARRSVKENTKHTIRSDRNIYDLL